MAPRCGGTCDAMAPALGNPPQGCGLGGLAVPQAYTATPVRGVAGRDDVVPAGARVDDQQREQAHHDLQFVPDSRPQVHGAPPALAREGVDGGQCGQGAPLDQHDPLCRGAQLGTL